VTKLHESEIAHLHPTQITVGMIEVHDKRKLIEKLDRSELRDYLAARPMPAVIGPHGRLHITDHHHLGRALWEARIDKALFLVEADYSGSRVESFWTEMLAKHWAHPIDGHGDLQPIEAIPRHLGELVDDPYRSLAGYVREAGGFEKTPTAFAEFLWADFFRQRIRITGPDRGAFERAVQRALVLAHRAEAGNLPGFVSLARS